MRLKHALIAIACTAIAATTRAGPVQLTHGDTVYELDPLTGALHGATRAGETFLDPSRDAYTLILHTSQRGGDEGGDHVLEHIEGDGAHTFKCVNEALGLTVRKTYRVEQRSSQLLKQTTYGATGGVDGLLLVESGWSVPADWWRGSIIWQPRWHTTESPFVRTRDIKKPRNLFSVNGCRAVFTLYQPGRERCLVHWRWGSDRWEFFDAFPETGDNMSRLPARGKRVRPHSWLLGSGIGFVTASTGRKFTSTMAYGVQEGSPLKFYTEYARSPEFRRILTDPSRDAPAWMADTVIDEAVDASIVNDRYKEIMRDFLDHKHPFGFVQAVYWRPWMREFYATTPEQVEAISGEDPVAATQFMADLQANHPRYKIGPYTHYGQSGAHPWSRLAETAWEKGWVPMRRDGMRVPVGADEAPYRYGVVPLRRTVPEYRAYLVQRWTDILENMDPDFINCDSSAAPPGRMDRDWRTMTAPQRHEVTDLWLEFLREANERGKAVHCNFPVPLGCNCGYSEFPWWPLFQQDWRLPSSRLALQQALSHPGFRLYPVGSIHRSGHVRDDAVRANLNYMTLLATGFSLLELKQTGLKEIFYREAAPYLQAAWEIRSRTLVDAEVAPNVFRLEESETEAYAWRHSDGYGMVTAENHDLDPLDEDVAFTTRPLGLRPGKPVLQWRLEMTDPRDTDFSEVTMDSPVRRLAQQTLLEVVPSLPGRVELLLDLPSENPVAVLLSPSPAVIVSVGGRPCQYWLPAAYGIKTSGAWDPAAGTASIMVDNPKAQAELLVLAAKGEGTTVTQRPWSETHAAGVAPGATAIDHSFVDVDGHTFAKLLVRKGRTELILGP